MQKNGENKMLNNQSRNCLVNTYAKFGEAEKVAQAFGVTGQSIDCQNKWSAPALWS